MFDSFDDIVSVDDLCNMPKIGKNNAYKLINGGQIKALELEMYIRFQSNM